MTKIIIGAGKTIFDGWIATQENEMDGKIGRSLRFDTRNSINDLKMVSIIYRCKETNWNNSKIMNKECYYD